MADNILDSFFVKLGFQPDTSGIGAFEQALAGLKNFMGGMSVAAIGAAGAIGFMIQDSIKQMADVNSFAEVVGQSANEIFAVGKAAAVADVTLESWESTVQSLSSMIGQASSGIGRGAQNFKKYGIEAKDAEGNTRDIRDVLGDVADKMQGMDQSERISMAQRLGIDPHAIALLKEGGKSFDEFYAAAVKGSSLTDADFALADNVDKGLERLKGSFGKVTRSIAAVLLPVLEPIVNVFVWLTKTITWLIDQAFGPLKVAAQAVGQALSWMSEQTSIIWKNFSKTGKASKVLATVFMVFRGAVVVATIALLSYLAALAVQKVIMFAAGIAKLPGMLWGMAAAARSAAGAMFTLTGLMTALFAAAAIVGLVVQDLWVYFNGGDSVTGDLIKQFPQLKSTIDALKPSILWIGKAFLSIWDQIVNAWAINGPWITEKFLALADTISNALQATAAFLAQFWQDNGATILNVIGNITGAVEGLINLIGAVISGLREALQKSGLLLDPTGKNKPVEAERGAKQVDRSGWWNTTKDFSRSLLGGPDRQEVENWKARGAAMHDLYQPLDAVLNNLTKWSSPLPQGTGFQSTATSSSVDQSTNMSVATVNVTANNATEFAQSMKQVARNGQTPVQ